MYSDEENNSCDDYDQDSGAQIDLKCVRKYYVSRAPENVKYFLQNFCQAIKEGAMLDIQNMYENTFPQMSDHHFDRIAWPDEREVADLVDNDQNFLILYKELYYRHIYARVPGGPTLKQRIDAFFNYCDFFNLIISSPKPVEMDLPDIWLWELIDEFVYQFHNYSQYRARLTEKTPQEIEQLCIKHGNVWSILCILNVLHSLADLSNIKKQLELMALGQNANEVAGEFGRLPFYKMLGYFSMIALLCVHCMLGDYYQALKVLEPIEIHKKTQYSHIPACQVTTFYYVGFAYMMMRRYSDAIRTFSEILHYVQRTKQLYNARSYQNDQIKKRSDQMFHLLTICLVLQPQYIDESIQQVLREKTFNEALFRMQSGDLDVFKAFFVYGCPRFISACPPSAEAVLGDYVKEPLEHQLDIFMKELQQQKKLPIIRSYLKLYKTLPISKLLELIEQCDKQCGVSEYEDSYLASDDKHSQLRSRLLCFKHKMRNLVWAKGTSGLDGDFRSVSELDFYIDDEMIYIADTKVSHRYGEFFIRKIQKLNDLNRQLENIKL